MPGTNNALSPLIVNSQTIYVYYKYRYIHKYNMYKPVQKSESDTNTERNNTTNWAINRCIDIAH